METKHRAWAHLVGGWCISAVKTAMQKTSNILDRHAQLSYRAMKSTSISSSTQISKQWWLCWKIMLCSWEFGLQNSVTVLFVSVVVSMEISRRHYFWRDLMERCGLCSSCSNSKSSSVSLCFTEMSLFNIISMLIFLYTNVQLVQHVCNWLLC